MNFEARWLDEVNWSIQSATVEAPSLAAARARLSTRGAVISIDELQSVASTALAGRERRVPRWDVAWWCRELAVLLGAGMTVIEAIDTLRMQADDAVRTELHRRLSNSLQQGQSLSSAMAETGAFPVVLVAGVVASERTGSLPDALQEFLRYHEMIDQLRRKLTSAALYPALVLAVGLVVVIFLMWFVVPRFSTAYADMRGAISGATQMLVLASGVLRQHGVWLAAALATTLACVWWLWKRGRLVATVTRAADAIGPIRSRLDDFRLAKLHHALALMFRGGYALPDAMLRCEAIGLGARWTSALAQARAAVLQGRSVSIAFSAAGLSDSVDQRLMAVGERVGSFAQVLQTIAERHGTRFATSVDQVTRLAEPLLLLFVALAVGAVVVLMYLPVFDLAGSLR